MIPSITLPVVIVATFAGMYLLYYSIDNLSLMALTIAIGFLVDDAIVMIENIVRHIEAGKPPLEAALDGAGEIGFTILSITLSLAAVFIPVLFMAGVVGLLFHEFAMTTVLAIFLSGLRVADADPDDVRAVSDPREPEQQGRFSRWLEHGFDRMRDLYDRGLIWALAHQFPMLMVNIGLIVLTVVPLHRDSEGVPARTGHRHLHRRGAGARGHRVRDDQRQSRTNAPPSSSRIPPSQASSASLARPAAIRARARRACSPSSSRSISARRCSR